jgi:hypothetical protein
MLNFPKKAFFPFFSFPVLFPFLLDFPYRSGKLYLNSTSYFIPTLLCFSPHCSIPTAALFSFLFHSNYSSFPLPVPFQLHLFSSSCSMPTTVFSPSCSIPTTALFPFLFYSHNSSFPLPVPFQLQLLSPSCSIHTTAHFPSCSIPTTALIPFLFHSDNSFFPFLIFPLQRFSPSCSIPTTVFSPSCYFHNSAFPLPVLLPLQCSFLNNISFNTSHAISSSAHLYQKI